MLLHLNAAQSAAKVQDDRVIASMYIHTYTFATLVDVSSAILGFDKLRIATKGAAAINYRGRPTAFRIFTERQMPLKKSEACL